MLGANAKERKRANARTNESVQTHAPMSRVGRSQLVKRNEREKERKWDNAKKDRE